MKMTFKNEKPAFKDADLFIKCDCHSEAMMVQKYAGEDEFYFSYWGEGTNPKSLSFRDKMILCWKTIFHGNPYIDGVILNKAKARKLAAFLTKHSI